MPYTAEKRAEISATIAEWRDLLNEDPKAAGQKLERAFERAGSWVGVAASIGVSPQTINAWRRELEAQRVTLSKSPPGRRVLERAPKPRRYHPKGTSFCKRCGNAGHNIRTCPNDGDVVG